MISNGLGRAGEVGFENGAWAPQSIERDGKWYMYCPLQGRGIGVLVADNPFGPFTDPIGKPLIGGNMTALIRRCLLTKMVRLIFAGAIPDAGM